MNFQIKRISSCKPEDRKKPSFWKYSPKPTSPKKSHPDPLNQYISQQSTMAWSSLQFKSVPKSMPVPITNTIDNRSKTKNTLRSILISGTSYVEHLRISSTSWCLYDQNKEKYLGFRERHQREIASLTKIMTSIISIEFSEKYQLNPELFIKVTQNASKMIGTTADLKQKTWVRFRDLIYGAMLPSGNDAAFLLSQVIGFMEKFDGKNKDQFLRNLKFLDISNENTTFYTIQFVKLMNKKAQQLGLILTKFSNPHGLQNALNVSSPRDMLMLSSYAAKNKLFRKIMNTQFHRYQFVQLIENPQVKNNQIQNELLQKSHSKIHKNSQNNNQNVKLNRRIWQNTNLLLKKGWEGVKTGQTGPAGSCLSSLKNGIFIVVLNCRDNEARFHETQKIYNWYINKRNSQSTDDQDNSPNIKRV